MRLFIQRVRCFLGFHGIPMRDRVNGVLVFRCRHCFKVREIASAFVRLA